MTSGSRAFAGGVGIDSLPPRVGRETLSGTIHEALESAIISGALEAGQRLRPDDIASHYQVSRIPVREALRSLQEAGWIELRPQQGAYVRARSGAELRELFDVRQLIEGHVAATAARVRTDADVDLLRDAVARSRRAAAERDLGALSMLGQTFYQALRAAAHNEVLASISRRLEQRARFYFSAIEDQMGVEWVEVHAQLCDLVAAGDEAAAGRAAAAHIGNTGRAVERLLQDQQQEAADPG